MAIAERVSELETEYSRQRELLCQVTARLNGIENELTVLRSGSEESTTPLSDMRRTDAILEVLRRSVSAMSPTEIRKVLLAAGRNDVLRSVTATLNYLVSDQKTVTRLARGQYVANVA